MKLLLLLIFPLTIQYSYRIIPDRTMPDNQTGGRKVLHQPIDLTLTIRCDSLWLDNTVYRVDSIEFEQDSDLVVRCTDNLNRDVVFYVWRSERLLFITRSSVAWDYFAEGEIDEW